jgi:4-hydroxysphinganine ceramide fatty acyl 2-hydroxylase
MEAKAIKNKGQARLFHNDLLETLSKTHPIVIYSLYIPLIAFMLWLGASRYGYPGRREAGLLAAGLLFWTLFEYVMHRYVFHLVVESALGKRLAYTVHGVHHEYPRDRSRLFMPLVPSVLISGLVFGLMYLVMGWQALAFFPGFLLGYLVYASMHYAIHAYAPPKLLKALWRNHHLHHYKTPDKGFGVSTVLWDVVFGTVPDKQHANDK